MSLRKRLTILAVLVLPMLGCAGPGRVHFDNGACFIDDHVVALSEVQARQASVTERILARQPIMVVITILIVALAGMSHVEKLVLLFSARRSEARSFGDRLRAALDRYRAHPIRYFTLVGVTFTLLLVAGSCYIYLDADKRASERALGSLQFCHLALTTAQEKTVLDEQRRNLDAIQSTAGEIRSLVDKLPPEEQRKGQLIIDQMNTALGKQGRLVGQYLQRSDDTAHALHEHSQLTEHVLANLEAGLKSLPVGLHDLSEQVHDLKLKLGTHDASVATEDTRLAAIEAAVKSMAARPEKACPTCVCETGNGSRPDGGVARPAR